MSNEAAKLKHAYSGWPIPARETPVAAPAAQLDLESEIERRVAERMAVNVVEMKAPKKAKKAEESAE